MKRFIITRWLSIVLVALTNVCLTREIQCLLVNRSIKSGYNTILLNYSNEKVIIRDFGKLIVYPSSRVIQRLTID